MNPFMVNKLQLKRRNLGRVFNFRSGYLHTVHLLCYRVKLPSLKLKTRPEQILGSLFTHKHYTRLQRLARDKHSSLLRKSVNYDRKKFYSTGPH